MSIEEFSVVIVRNQPGLNGEFLDARAGMDSHEGWHSTGPWQKVQAFYAFFS